MRRFVILLAALALPTAVLADAASWRTVHVDISVLPDGTISVVERDSVLIPEDMTVIKRQYWFDSDEHVTAVRVVRVRPDGTETPEQFEISSWGQLQVTVPPGGEGPQNLDLRIETIVTGVVVPVWAIRRGVRQLDRKPLAEPLDRLKDIVSLWHEVGNNRGSRYLLDYQFFFPDDQGNLDVQPSLSLTPAWKAVHPIPSDHVATVVKSTTFGLADSIRVSHVLDYVGSGTPSAVDIRTHRIRALSIAAFPVLAIVIWLAYLGRLALTRPKFALIDEAWLREHLFNEHPEVIAARWSGWTPITRIEDFLRRLESDGKIALDIRTLAEGTDDEDLAVNIRLRVPREQLSEYERCVIDALIPDGNAVDSRDLQQLHRGTAFDPMAKAHAWLRKLGDDTRRAKSPVISRTFSFALFAAGMWLLILETVRNAVEPVAPAATWIFVAPLVALWPSRWVTNLTRKRMIGGLLLWIPLLLMCAFLIVIHTLTPQPLGVYASVGLLLALLGAFHSIVADAVKTGKQTRLQRVTELAAAEQWLRSPHARIRAEWGPYLEALGVKEHEDEDENVEEWGYKLYTFTENSARQQ